MRINTRFRLWRTTEAHANAVHQREVSASEKQKRWREGNPEPFGIQVFLNPAESNEDGWLKGSVTYPNWGRGLSIKLQVADCTRIITLDFDPDESESEYYSAEARIQKIAKLRSAIDTFCDNATIHLSIFQARIEQEKANKNTESGEEKS